MAKRQELYFRVKVGLRESDGAGVLERRLGDPRAYTYVPDLWDWFVQKHPEGQVTGPDAAFLIARGSGWQGDADKFCAAMVAAGFLGEITEGFRVKGWREWAGFHYEVRAKENAKKQKQRDDSEGCPPVSPGDVPGMSRGQGAEKTASEGVCPGDTSPISDLVSSKGGVGGVTKRRGLGAPDSHPLTAAVLAALHDRGWDADWPKKPGVVEAAIQAATIPVAVERLLAMVNAERTAGREPKPWLGWHVDVINPKANDRGRQAVGQDFTKPVDWS